jgi:hypothetical protein
MQDRSSKSPGNKTEKRGHGPKDVNELAFSIVQQAIGEIDRAPDKPEKNPAAVTLGRLGGLKGGAARAAKLTPEKRVEIAKKAAEKRWERADLNDKL